MGGPGNKRRKLAKKCEGIAKAMKDNYVLRNPKQKAFEGSPLNIMKNAQTRIE